MIQHSQQSAFHAFPRIRFIVVFALVLLGVVLQNDRDTLDLSFEAYHCIAVTAFQMLIWYVARKGLFIAAKAIRCKGADKTLELTQLILAEVVCFHVSLIAAALFFFLPGNSQDMSFSSYGPGGIAHIVNGKFTLDGLVFAQSLFVDAYVTATLICLVCLAAIFAMAV